MFAGVGFVLCAMHRDAVWRLRTTHDNTLSIDDKQNAHTH